jgi:large subunit ribosomal protein L10
MPQTKAQKQKVLEDLRDKIARQKAIIFVGITGLKVKDVSELRKKLKAMEANLKVFKKTLAEIVFKENKLEFDKRKFKEEIALVFGFKDELSPVKTVYQFSTQNDKLKILGGFLGNKFKEKEEIITLAQLPGREELLAKLVGSLNASVSGLVNVLQGNIKGLVFALSSIKKQN